MKKILLLLLLPTILFSQSLQSVYILSEGGFSPESSQLSMIDVANDSYTSSLIPLGLYPDGIILDGSTIYIAEQGSWGGAGRAYILDSIGTLIDTTNVGLNPFSLTKANNKLYLTNGGANNVSVLNADDLSLVTEIAVGAYPQEILSIGKYVFVANTSVWGGAVDSTVSVIDSEIDSVVASIQVKPTPSSLALAADGDLFIGCPGDETSGYIYKVNPTTFEKVDSFLVAGEGFGSSICADPNSSNIYFKSSLLNIVELNIETGSVRKITGPEGVNYGYAYGYAFEYTSQQHYVLDAIDFTSNGSLTVYNNSGEEVKTYETSIAPKRVVFKYTNNATDVKQTETLPNSFALEQNYPNPFNPTTNIKFSITASSLVELSVYNMLGQKVAELVNENLSAGQYEVNFNGQDLTSGIYFYSLKTNEAVQTKKMTLIK